MNFLTFITYNIYSTSTPRLSSPFIRGLTNPALSRLSLTIFMTSLFLPPSVSMRVSPPCYCLLDNSAQVKLPSSHIYSLILFNSHFHSYNLIRTLNFLHFIRRSYRKASFNACYYTYHSAPICLIFTMLPIQIIIHHTFFCLVVHQSASYISNLSLPTFQIPLLFSLFLKTSPSISVCIQIFSPFWKIRFLNRNPSTHCIFFLLLFLFTLCLCHLVLYYLVFHNVIYNKNNYSLLQISFYLLYCSTRFFLSHYLGMDNKRSYASVCAGLPAGLQAAPLPRPPQSSSTKRSRTYRSKEGRKYRASRKKRSPSATMVLLSQSDTSVQVEASVYLSESPYPLHMIPPLPLDRDSSAPFCASVLPRFLDVSQPTLSGPLREAAISAQVEAIYAVREKSTRLGSRLPDDVYLSETPPSMLVMHKELPELKRYLQGPSQSVSLLGSQAPNGLNLLNLCLIIHYFLYFFTYCLLLTTPLRRNLNFRLVALPHYHKYEL